MDRDREEGMDRGREEGMDRGREEGMDRDKDVKTIFQQYIYGKRSDIYSTYIALSLCILPYRSKLWGLTVSKSTKSYWSKLYGCL